MNRPQGYLREVAGYPPNATEAQKHQLQAGWRRAEQQQIDRTGAVTRLALDHDRLLYCPCRHCQWEWETGA